MGPPRISVEYNSKHKGIEISFFRVANDTNPLRVAGSEHTKIDFPKQNVYYRPALQAWVPSEDANYFRFRDAWKTNGSFCAKSPAAESIVENNLLGTTVKLPIGSLKVSKLADVKGNLVISITKTASWPFPERTKQPSAVFKDDLLCLWPGENEETTWWPNVDRIAIVVIDYATTHSMLSAGSSAAVQRKSTRASASIKEIIAGFSALQYRAIESESNYKDMELEDSGSVQGMGTSACQYDSFFLIDRRSQKSKAR